MKQILKFFSNHSLKYSIAVEEGNYSATQRQTELQQLLHFKEIGIPIANKSILKAAMITNKNEVIQEMEQEAQQQMQMQQQQAQVQQQKDQAEIFMKTAKAKSDLAKERELMASAQEKIVNIENIHATAEAKQMETDYNLVKLAMELEDVQFNQLKNAFELAQAMKIVNQPQQMAQI